MNSWANGIKNLLLRGLVFQGFDEHADAGGEKRA